jgi:death on curing protein
VKWHYLDLVDFLLIAEEVLDIPAERLAQLGRLGLADSALNAPAAGIGEVEAYADFESKAAALCWHLIKNHPLPDGNKRVGFLSLIEFAHRNGRRWTQAPGDPAETDATLRGVAAGTVSKKQLASWIAERAPGP